MRATTQGTGEPEEGEGDSIRAGCAARSQDRARSGSAAPPGAAAARRVGASAVVIVVTVVLGRAGLQALTLGVVVGAACSSTRVGGELPRLPPGARRPAATCGIAAVGCMGSCWAVTPGARCGDLTRSPALAPPCIMTGEERDPANPGCCGCCGAPGTRAALIGDLACCRTEGVAAGTPPWPVAGCCCCLKPGVGITINFTASAAMRRAGGDVVIRPRGAGAAAWTEAIVATPGWEPQLLLALDSFDRTSCAATRTKGPPGTEALEQPEGAAVEDSAWGVAWPVDRLAPPRWDTGGWGVVEVVTGDAARE